MTPTSLMPHLYRSSRLLTTARTICRLCVAGWDVRRGRGINRRSLMGVRRVFLASMFEEGSPWNGKNRNLKKSRTLAIGPVLACSRRSSRRKWRVVGARLEACARGSRRSKEQAGGLLSAMLQRFNSSLDEELLGGDGFWTRDRLEEMDARFVAAMELAFAKGMESRAAAAATYAM